VVVSATAGESGQETLNQLALALIQNNRTLAANRPQHRQEIAPLTI
jgi:hypothetical protein